MEGRLLEKFYKLTCDTELIGLIKERKTDPYFCTPEGAIVFARLGVDGIHFCFIPSLQPDIPMEEGMVYVVAPMDPDQQVRPVANNLKEFLEIVVSCGDAGVLDQVGTMDQERYNDFIKQVEVTPEMQQVIEEIKTTLGLQEKDNVLERIRDIQEDFDHNTIPFSDEYYEITGIERE